MARFAGRSPAGKERQREDGMQDIETLWADFARPIETADDYIASLRGRRMNIYFMGERVPEPVDHPVIKPSINAMAETYRLASERPVLGSVRTEIGGCQTNRFLHVPTALDELVVKHEMQRELGRRTGTCFQRCVGLDAIGTCHSVPSTSMPNAAPTITIVSSPSSSARRTPTSSLAAP
jgi:4-hydroxybutyryl-CoA dehydratase/vinylacetyl-CoA-Delta-isomerase